MASGRGTKPDEQTKSPEPTSYCAWRACAMPLGVHCVLQRWEYAKARHIALEGYRFQDNCAGEMGELSEMMYEHISLDFLSKFRSTRIHMIPPTVRACLGFYELCPCVGAAHAI